MGKIGETIILQYKDSQSACNIKNFELLLITYKQLIIYLAQQFDELGAVAFIRYIVELDREDTNILKLQLQYALEIIVDDSIIKHTF